MDIPRESYKILGILTYLDYPKYLTKTHIKCVTDIFDKMEEEIEDLTIQIEELEKYYSLIKDENDKELFLNKLNNKKEFRLNIQNQLKFINQ
jgi:hypothetical protein